ncbi:MAG: Ig-like domain-containing protein [Methylophilus sp.]
MMTQLSRITSRHCNQIGGWIKVMFATALLLSLSTLSYAATTITLTAPATNTQFGAPATITLNAEAIPDAGQTISNVKFYRGTTLIGTDTTAPYSVTWSNAAAGTYSLTAKATNNLNQTATSAASSVIVTAAPTVALSAPAANAGFNTGSTITVTATATPSSGQSITQVEFFATTTIAGVPSTQSIGIATTSPYSVSWSNTAAGTYSLTAKATDNLGGTKTSAARTINVANPPTATLMTPAANAQFGAPANITLTAEALADTGSPTQTISNVKFYRGTTLIGTATTAPYSVTWSNAAAGTYSLTAKATTSLNLTTTSAANSITIKASPTVALSAPANNASFTANPTITVSANATPSSGQSITQVEFFASIGTATPVLIGTDTTAPYSISWSNVAGATYSLKAKATDNLGGTKTSTARTIIVATAPNVPPTVSLTSPANNSSYTQGDNIPFAATATDSDGSIAKVEFYDGSTLIYTATTAPYSIGVAASTIGTHTVTAVATDNTGATTISNAAQVTINAVTNTTPQAYYIHTDQLNTPRLITDNNNQAVWRWDNWEPFGNYITDEDPGNTGNKFTYNPRFAGQYYDAETGLSYNYFRDYNPQTGRYLQSDPIGLEGGQFSTYAYVDGSPIGSVDPMGLAECTLDFVTGRLLCLSNMGDKSLDIPVASGNNGAGSNCKNNPDCDGMANKGPIPRGNWEWTSGYTAKPNGRVLKPKVGTNTHGRTNIRSHSCKNPFGPSKGPKFCSEGCLTGTAPDIIKLNDLIDNEPNSTLHVGE